MRVIALLATYNERRFIDGCLEHLHSQGVETYLLDDGSTDDTIELAERWLGRGLIGIEELPRDDEDTFDLKAQLERKEELACELEADWFIHLDADELRLPPSDGQTLSAALELAGREGYNAVNFLEFTFIPTVEDPDHDHPDFQQTLRTYYPYLPKFPHRLNAWKANDEIELAQSNGHKARFRGLRMYPRSFSMKHYLFLSVPHAVEKYVQGRLGRRSDCWRSHLTESNIRLLPQSEVRVEHDGVELDARGPRTRHYLADLLGTRL